MNPIIRSIRIKCDVRDDGTIVLWNSGDGWNEQHFKTALFGWHRASYYGTFIDIVKDKGQFGAVLPPLGAVDYLAEPPLLRHVQVEWARGAEEVLAAAKALRGVLEAGLYAPSFEKWRAGKAGFRIAAPAGWGETEQALRGGRSGSAELLERWLDAALHEMASRDDQGDEAALLRRMSELQAGPLSELWDEEDWWHAIGYAKEKPPCRVALRLTEPAPEEWAEALDAPPSDDAGSIVQVRSGGEDDSVMWTLDWHVIAAAGADPEQAQAYASRRQAKLLRWIAALAPELLHAGGTLRRTLTSDGAWTFLAETSVTLAEAGMDIYLPEWWEEIQRLKPRLRASVRSTGAGRDGGGDFSLQKLVQFDWKVAVGDEEMTEEELKRALERGAPLMRIGRRWVHLDSAFLAELRRTMKNVERRGLTLQEALRLYWEGAETDPSKNQEAADDGLASEEHLRLEVELHAQLLEWVKRLEQTDRVPLLPPPEEFAGEMRPYQQTGMSWLSFMRQFGLGCCLADDMGLGKTIQYIAYLLQVKKDSGFITPALLVCPTSVLGNWEKELVRFAPALSVYIHHGSNRAKGEAFETAVAGTDIVVTSYSLIHLDEAEWTGREWSALCLDEAQNIKNAHTKQSSAVRRITATHRVALTGTPIENRLAELWSIYEFLNPGYLGGMGEFQRTYASASAQGEETTRSLQRLVRPFLLRRLKTDPSVALSLPEKIESKAYINMSVEAAALYERIVSDALAEAERKTGMSRKAHILSMLTQLKQVCDHPALYRKESPDAWVLEDLIERSMKLERLLEMVEEALEEGDRCLIFTQYVEMGRMLQWCIEMRFGLERKVPFLHGGIPKAQRDRMVQQFQSGEGPGVFLLSLKAGGVGLNLTAAQHVFHYDRWWNPAVEEQATDRAYRIGQTRNVQVHKLVTIGTLEERIDDLLTRKRQLNNSILGTGEQWMTELTTDDLRELVALRISK